MSTVSTAPVPAEHPMLNQLRQVRRWHRPLLVTVGLMGLLAVVSAVGLLVDDRELLGVSVWWKPLKFALSVLIYGLNLAWLLSLPHRGSRWTNRIATVVAAAIVLDIGVIAMQAARGTMSHFNASGDLFAQITLAVFMIALPGMFLASVVLSLILIFQRIVDRPTTRAIRAGLVISIVGMSVGFLMSDPSITGSGATTDALGHQVEFYGGHSVGVPEGGPGLPAVGWSTTGGDLRVPHFVGIHGLQVVLIAALLLTLLAARYPRLRDERVRTGLVGVVAAGYVGLLALVTWQAMRGEPLVHPSAETLYVLAGLVLASGTAGWAVLARRRTPVG